MLDEIEEAVKRADSIVRALMEYSAFGEFDLKTWDVNAIIRESLRLVRYEMMKEQQKRILVVDDEVSFTRLLKMNLENYCHYQVVIEKNLVACH